MADLSELTSKISAFIETAKQSAKDGLTVSEFTELSLSAIRIAMQAVDVLSLPGAEKKALVIQVAGAVFDALADRCIPLVLYPFWVLVRPAARSLWCAIAGGAVETLLPLVRLTA